MGRYVYQWPQPEIVCISDEDAMLLVLKFGGKRVDSAIEKMIKRDNNSKI